MALRSVARRQLPALHGARRRFCAAAAAVQDGLPATMSAVQIATTSGELLGSDMKAIRAAGSDVTLSLRDTQPLPQLRSDEVLIKVDYAGVNRPDVVQRKGLYPPPPGASEVLGLEVSGTVVGLGTKLESHSMTDPWGGAGPLKIGDKVCALLGGGGYAEYATAPASTCLRVPLGFSQLEAAALPETFFTVWTNVFQRGVRGAELSEGESIMHFTLKMMTFLFKMMKTGESIMVHGGTSGIGTTAIQLAKALGAISTGKNDELCIRTMNFKFEMMKYVGAKHVIATAGSDEKCKSCLALGATTAINYKDQDYATVSDFAPYLLRIYSVFTPCCSFCT